MKSSMVVKKRQGKAKSKLEAQLKQIKSKIPVIKPTNNNDREESKKAENLA